MTWQSRRCMPVACHHFSAPRATILASKGGFSSCVSQASEPVILSAAGAKDLLSRRCEGPAFGERSEEQQVLGSRASRALAQDDNAAASVREKDGVVVSLSLITERAGCHPERRRREGPAFAQMRRALGLAVQGCDVYSPAARVTVCSWVAQPTICWILASAPTTRWSSGVAPRPPMGPTRTSGQFAPGRASGPTFRATSRPCTSRGSRRILAWSWSWGCEEGHRPS